MSYGETDMAGRRRDVTGAELAILRVLWDRGRATIRQLTDILYPSGGISEYATVKKLLTRLEHKGCVTHDRREAAHVFAAKITRDDLLGRRLDSLAEELCDGSRTPLLMTLLSAQNLTKAQRQELDRFLDELIRSRSARTRKGT